MTPLVPLEPVENKAAQTVGWLISLPAAIALLATLMWFAAGLHWNVGGWALALAFATAALGVVIKRAVEKRLTLRWHKAALERVAEPIVTVSTKPVIVGGMFQVTYRQRLLQPLEIKQVSIQLVRRTRQVYQRSVMGVSETVERKRERVIQSQRLNGGRFQTEDTFQQTVSLMIPDTETPTSQTGNRYEEWVVRTRLVIAGGPAYMGEYALEVNANKAAD